jgi:hypothetical protein
LLEEIILQETFMGENIHRGFVPELIEVLGLVTIFAIRRINLQHILYFTAFLTFGIGDGMTGAYMMDRLGVGIESNQLAKYLFMTEGFWGMVAVKMWFTLAVFVVVFIVQMKSPDNMYWTTNGFLLALTAGGVMAVNANLNAISGNVFQAPEQIIFIFLAMALIFTEIGSYVDKHAVFEEVADVRGSSFDNTGFSVAKNRMI